MKISSPAAMPPPATTDGTLPVPKRGHAGSDTIADNAGKSTLADRRNRPVPSTPESGLPALVPGEYATDTGDIHLNPIIPNVDVRSLTPREMSNLSFDLYANGILKWEEYELLAFQPDLNPGFDSTVGALTGKLAEPDTPKDHLAHWEERYAFERKYNSDRPDRLRTFRQVVNVMRQLAAPLNVVV